MATGGGHVAEGGSDDALPGGGADRGGGRLALRWGGRRLGRRRLRQLLPAPAHLPSAWRAAPGLGLRRRTQRRRQQRRRERWPLLLRLREDVLTDFEERRCETLGVLFPKRIRQNWRQGMQKVLCRGDAAGCASAAVCSVQQ